MKIDSLIFDCDGVLVDVGRSYRKAVQLTANYFLGQNLIKLSDINIIKGLTGYNNDWDTTYALIKLVQKKIPKKNWPKQALSLLPINRRTDLFKKVYLVFQNYYLGSVNLRKFEKISPLFSFKGLFKTEKNLLSKKLVLQLKKSYQLGVVSGRPRKELILALKSQSLLNEAAFEKKLLIGKEDTKKEKPNPEPILKMIRILRSKNPIYIGDSLSDVEASRAAQVPCLFVGKSQNINNLIKNLFIN